MNYVGIFYSLHDQPQPLDFSAVLGAGGHNINAGRVNAAMAQDVCQLRNILFNAIESSGKEFPQIVREHLAGIDSSLLTQRFHLRPDTTAIQRFSVSGEKDHTGADFFFFGVVQQ